MNLLIHKSRVYSVWKEISAKKKVSIKHNCILERTGNDKVVRAINGLEEDTMIWFCDNKQIFYGKVHKANEGYKLMEMVGKEFEKRVSATWWIGEKLFCINKPGEFVSFDPKSLLTTDVIFFDHKLGKIGERKFCDHNDFCSVCVCQRDSCYRLYCDG
jgi:hypothetical protein